MMKRGIYLFRNRPLSIQAPQLWIKVGFSGLISGDYFLAVEPEDWKLIVADMSDPETDQETFMLACLKELLNTISAQAIEILAQDFSGLTISPPSMIEGVIHYPETKIFTCILDHEHYHPIKAYLCINLMKHNIEQKLEEEIARTVKEIARAKKAENAIQAIMENTIHGLFLLDEKGVILPGVSKQMEHLFFKPLHEIEEHKFIDVCPFEITESDQEIFLRWLNLSASHLEQDNELFIKCPIPPEVTFKIDNHMHTYAFSFLTLPRESEGKIMVIITDETVEKELLISNKNLHKKASTDGLTGLVNRNFFISALGQAIATSLKFQHPLCILMCDIDYFKSINDTHGHLAGDKVLTETAKILQSHIRDSGDICGRYGGEEFIISLRNTTQSNGLKVAEILRRSVENNKIVYQDESISVTISIGVCTLENFVNESVFSMIERADKALYQAKNNGRNQVCLERQKP